MPPETLSVQPPQTHRNLWLVLLAVILLAVIVLYFAFLSGGRRVTVRSNGPFKGSLVVFLPTEWKVSSNEKVSGLIAYNPSTHEVSRILPMNIPTVVSATESAFSADGVHVLATKQASTTQLVSVNLLTQSVDKVIKTLSGGGTISSFIWSPDGSKVAYVALDHKNGAHVEINGKSVGDARVNAPLMFSPDSKEIILDSRPLLETLDVASGNRTTLTGTAFDQGAVLTPSLTGKYLFVVPPAGGLATLYRVDWKTHALVQVAYLKTDGGSVLFTPDDELLQVKQGGVAYDYQITDTALQLHEVYKFDLPDNAKVLYWKKL